MNENKIRQALRDLRHLYEQMLVPGAIKDQKSAANGLLAPAIRKLEKADLELEEALSYLRQIDVENPFTGG